MIVTRAPTPEDAARVFALIPSVGELERNTCYAYVLLCTHFAGTAVIAEDEAGALAGFVLGYRPPTDPASVFVWQVGVAPSHRGRGVGGRLLDALLARPACVDVTSLTATVAPDNVASRALFHGLANRLGTSFVEEPGFPARLFAGPHADERLVRVGPIGRPSTSPQGAS